MKNGTDLDIRCLAVFRPVVSGLQMVNDYVSNDLHRISCVNSRIGEISTIRGELDSIAKEKSRLKEQLREARARQEAGTKSRTESSKGRTRGLKGKAVRENIRADELRKNSN